MRRRSWLIGLTLPAAHALSLSDFQRNLSKVASKACETAYESQISACTQNDFIISCSTPCVSGLISITKEVMEACRGIKVESNYLLGLVLDGRMVESLCQPPDRQTMIYSPFDPLYTEKLRFAGLPRANALSSSELSTLFLTTSAPNTQREPTNSISPSTTYSFTILHLSVSSSYKETFSSTTRTIISSSFSPAPTTNPKLSSTTILSTYTSEMVITSIPTITSTSHITSSTMTVISKSSTTSMSSLSSVPIDRNETLPTSSAYKPSLSVQTISPTPNVDTGGGSPFDVQSSSGNLTLYNGTIIISTIYLLLIAILQY